MCQIGDEIRVLRIPKSKPIIAYRAWGVYGGTLHPLSYTRALDEWLGVTSRADKCPTKLNRHGLWCYKTPSLRQSRLLHGEAFGTIAIYGRVVEHMYGYRAEYAEIRSLTVKQHVLHWHGPMLRERYGVRIRVRAS
jgi:hypothetical protein